MNRERVRRERDELDSLAAEAGHQSTDLVGLTALILVMALILIFAI